MSALLITGLKTLCKERVLTPRGKDMIPKLGPVVVASPIRIRKLTYLSDYGNEIFELARPRGLERSGHRVFKNISDSERHAPVRFYADSRFVLQLIPH
jgi:hypothetical protein